MAHDPDTTQTPEPLLTVADVATWLRIEPKRVYELPIRKTKVGARVRYAASDVRLYLSLSAA
jgi:hypothetical protein